VHVNASCASARGFSLIEVMVALIVICVGLLGIAKMQALSLSNSTTSRMRSLAAIEGASLAAAMHSNRQYWANTAPTTVTVNPGVIASTDAALAAAATADLTNLTACFGAPGTTAKCAALPLAALDLARWSTSLNALLPPPPAPNSMATISCPPVAGAPTSCTIQISWGEKAVAVNQQQTAAATSAQCLASATGCFQVPTYTLYVEP
jgi:type IV pilus assembly protein PilV